MYELNGSTDYVDDFPRLPFTDKEWGHISISAPDWEESSNTSSDDIDTSHIVAPDDRQEDVPPTNNDVPPDPPDDIPPIDAFPADDFPEDPEEPIPDAAAEERSPGTSAALGEITTAPVVSVERTARTLDALPEGLEVRLSESSHVIVNRTHPDQALVDEAVAMLEGGQAWEKIDVPTAHRPNRELFVNDRSNPTLLLKRTDHSQDSREAVDEMAMAAEVRAVIDTEEAQQLAQAQGFSGISFVEPLAAVMPHDSKTHQVVYPLCEGQPLPETQKIIGPYPPGIPTTPTERLDAVVADLIPLLWANQMHPSDLNRPQILVEPGGKLDLIDTEEYTKLETAPPALQPDEVARLGYESAEWERGLSVSGVRNEFTDLEVEPGTTMVTRQENATTVSELFTQSQGGWVVAAWNMASHEAAIINASDLSEGARQLVDTLRLVPNLDRPGTIIHLVGDAEFIADEVGLTENSQFAVLLNPPPDALIKTVVADGSADVVLNPATGRVSVFNEDGEQTYTYSPPKALSSEE